MDDFLALERAAHDGAYGRDNHVLPTPAECAADDYRKGFVRLHALDIAIENSRGSIREGKTADGRKWSNRMAAHYGEFVGTTGADGDGVDVFIGPYPESQQVWVINQSFDGKFDEHKVMFGFPDAESAKSAYANSYTRDWTGFGSMVAMSLSDFKQWLGTNPQTPVVEKSVDKVLWDGETPRAQTFDAVLYGIRRLDSEGLIFDAVTEDEILQDADEVMTLDAMTSPYKTLGKRMELLKNILNKVSGLDVAGYAITKPYRVRGIINIAVIFELSDGQTITIYFHSGGSNVKVKATDELISWKWMLNKKDITIVVARESGNELNIRDVARRVMRLAIKNSPTFTKANARKSDKLASIDQLKTQIAAAETELADLQAKVAAKHAERQAVQLVEAAKVAANKLDPAEAAQLRASGVSDADMAVITPHATYAAFATDIANQDIADNLMQDRMIAIRNALREMGWDGPRFQALTKINFDGTYAIAFQSRSATSHNTTNFLMSVGRVADGRESHVSDIPNDMTKSAAELAARVDSLLPAVAPVVEETSTLAAHVATAEAPSTAQEPTREGAATTVPIVADVPVDTAPTGPVVATQEAEMGARAVETQQTYDLNFLQSVTDGTIDLWADDLASRIEAVLLAHPDDAAMQERGVDAINAYSNAMVAGARVAMDAVTQVPDPRHDMPPSGERANELDVQTEEQKAAAALAVRQQNGADCPTPPTSTPVPEHSTLDDAVAQESNRAGILNPPKEPVTPEQAAGATGGVPVPAIDTSGELAEVPAAPDMPSIDRPVTEGAPALDTAATEVAQIEPTESSSAAGTVIQIQENGQSEPVLAEAKAEVGAELLLTEPNLPIAVPDVEPPPVLKPVPNSEPTPETPAVREENPLPVAGDTNTPLDASPMDVPTETAPPPIAAEPTTEQVPDARHDTPPPSGQAAVAMPLDAAQMEAEKPTEVVCREADQAYLDSVIDGSEMGEAGLLGALFESYVQDDEMSGKWREAVAAFTERMKS